MLSVDVLKHPDGDHKIQNMTASFPQSKARPLRRQSSPRHDQGDDILGVSGSTDLDLGVPTTQLFWYLLTGPLKAKCDLPIVKFAMNLNPAGPGTFYSFSPTYCFNNCSANVCPENSACVAGICVWNRYEKLWKTYLTTVAQGGGALCPGIPTLVPSVNVQGSYLAQSEIKT